MASFKDRFLADEARVRRWNDFVASDLFIQARDAAMLELMVVRRGSQPVYDAQAAHHALEGAMAFADILMRLGTRAEPRGTQTGVGLSYESAAAQVKLPESILNKLKQTPK